MNSSALLLAVALTTGLGVTMSSEDRTKQDTLFRELWNEDFQWKFSELPLKGGVPQERVPYSGHIYLDKHGGTAAVLQKYDAAINRNGYPATAWERSDTAAAFRTRGGRFFRSTGINHWYGHCNGWSSAAIRHAEPQQSVVAYGMEFTPADIKALLAEIYMYNEHELLAGFETQLNAGTLHAILANWLGRGSHPIVMDKDPGEEKWNYPIYAYASAAHQRSAREVEVRTNIVYAKDTEDREYDRSPRNGQQLSFHYMLELNHRGEIIGGYYFNDSAQIDFVWIPLSPKPSGEAGNEGGNPHVDVEKVLAIWRRSVPLEVRRKWPVIDPLDRDRAVEVSDPSQLLPRNILIVSPTVTQ